MYACIGVAVGLLLVAVLFLIVATVSARFTASRPFVSSRKLRCLRATNCVVCLSRDDISIPDFYQALTVYWNKYKYPSSNLTSGTFNFDNAAPGGFNFYHAIANEQN